MKTSNRWMHVVVGIVILLLAGLVYAWSVLQAPIAKAYPDWTKAQLSLTFTITMFCFCIGGFVGGMLQKRLAPRTLVWVAAGLFVAGFALTSTASSLMGLYLGFGVLAGLASGLAYNATLGAVLPWFPDKQGLVSGVLLMGFGMSSFVVGKVYTAVTPSDGGGAWRTSFMIMGIIILVVMAVAGFFVRKPDASWKAPASPGKKPARASFEEIGAREMVRRPSFWLFILWATLLSAAGLAIVSQGSPIAQEACPGMDMSTVATLVGVLSIMNGLGRIIFGAMFDRLGRATTMLAVGIVNVAAMGLLVVALTGHNFFALVFGYVLTGLAYGGVPTSNSVFTSTFYGQRNYPVNLSIVNLNLLVASFGSTIAGMVYDTTRSYVALAAIVAVAVIAGSVASFLIRTPVSATSRRPR